MANNLKHSFENRNAAADARLALLNNGYLRIYDGAQPASPNDAITTQTLLAELRFGNPAFGAAVNGVATANALTGDAAANATGTAAWFRALGSDGTSAQMDGTVGTSGCDLNMANTVSVVTGVAVDVTALTYTEPA